MEMPPPPDPKARLPRTEYPPLRIVRFSGTALTYGAAPHTIEGVMVPITTPAKTVVDCFRYRNKIYLDVALEALRDCFHQRKVTLDEIWEAAKVCRAANVIYARNAHVALHINCQALSGGDFNCGRWVHRTDTYSRKP